MGTILFVLKLIKNGVTELLESPSASASDPHPATDRPRSGRANSPTRPTSASGRSRQRSVSRGRRPTQTAAAAAVAEALEVGDGGDTDKEKTGKEGGEKERKEEEEMDDETLEAAVRDLRTCMELVMKRLDIGEARQTASLPTH